MALESMRRLRDPRLLSASEVPVSQILLALSGYVLLAVAARSLPAESFTVLSSFYLLLNTVGRGVFASVELETNRAVAAAVAAGRSSAPTQALVARHTVLLIALSVVLAFASTPLLPAAHRDLALVLAAGAVTMAMSYGVRGPLAALRRYHSYSATYLIEAAATVAGALLLSKGDVVSVEFWAVLLVVSPAIGATVTAVVLGKGRLTAKFTHLWRQRSVHLQATSSHQLSYVSLGALLWTTAFFLASQGVWNLAPVAVTSRLTSDPGTAAGFVAVAIILRVPVFVFPGLQAVLLPMVSAAAERGDRQTIRRTLTAVLAVLLGGAVVWLGLAVTIVPWVARFAFAITDVPSNGAIIVLAASTIIGAAATVIQLRALAYRRHRAIALAWLAGLATLIGLGILPLPAELGGAVAQVGAAAVVLGGILIGDRAVRRHNP